MTYKQTSEIIKYCKDNGLPKPTNHRMPQSDEHWVMWNASYDLQYFTYKGARHYIRSLEYERDFRNKQN